ncbi:seminase-like [Bactrocera tryoni]|uniref:seminase-like n=1 Tax=Bactrocera tryoni TaxID=59916 RepID=UPI001A99E820|nr:seminase-like [Bactrocera tryoni]
MSHTHLKLVISAFMFLWLCHRTTLAAKASLRITGGRTTTIARAPYMVQIRYNGKFECGGTLISTTHVLTAAHCIKGKRRAGFIIHANTTRLSQAGIRRRVSRAFVPRRFTTATKRMDVAVLKLAAAINGTYAQPIGLCNTRLTAGLRMTILGWGTTSESSSRASNVLRRVNVPVIRKAKCRRQYRNIQTLTRTMFCAGVPGTKDSCSGDSGGPAVHNGRVCGIVSFGYGCARPNYPGVYTSVPMVRRFINRALAQ